MLRVSDRLKSDFINACVHRYGKRADKLERLPSEGNRGKEEGSF